MFYDASQNYLDIATSQRTQLLANVAKFQWPDNEKDNELKNTEAGNNVDHDVAVVLGSCSTASVNTTQHSQSIVTIFNVASGLLSTTRSVSEHVR